jgi:TonB family protein
VSNIAHHQKWLRNPAIGALFFVLGVPSLHSEPAEITKPQPGTFEYARSHAIHAPLPRYPYAAWSRHITGNGIFELQLRPDGSVSEVRTLRTTGSSFLDTEARDTLYKWRFHAGQFKTVRIPLAFALSYRTERQ